MGRTITSSMRSMYVHPPYPVRISNTLSPASTREASRARDPTFTAVPAPFILTVSGSGEETIPPVKPGAVRGGGGG